ncbi:MAG: SDR family oxidoreductase [Gammaproteobacteria bacterium]|nr:SDR family oxidoreductase [Gammaproteobacteria bacterium]
MTSSTVNTIAVTGANGFIGTALCCYLVSRGYRVIGLVRNPENLATRVAHEYRKVGDITPETQWLQHLGDVDAIVHLAARVHVMEKEDTGDTGVYYRLNTQATMALARSAVKAGVKRFVYLSSIKVNGEATGGKPFAAADIPDPKDDYGRSKAQAEQELMELASGSSIGVSVIRPPLVYGPGVKGNLERLCRILKKELPLPLGSTGNRRDMVSINNLNSLIESCLVNEAAPGNVFLVSDGCPVSTTRLVRTLASAMGVRARLFPVPRFLLMLAGTVSGRGEEVRRLTENLEVDISRTCEVLGWKPVDRFEDALRETVSSFSDRGIS